MKNSYVKKEAAVPSIPSEETLKDAYIEEYNEKFPNILEEDPNEFFENLRKRVKLSLEEKFNTIPEDFLNKVEAQINAEYYTPHFKKASAMYLSQIKVVSKLSSSNDMSDSSGKKPGKRYSNDLPPAYFQGPFVKHCKLTEDPVHVCGEKFIQAWSSSTDRSSFFLLCLKCKKVYQPNFIHLFCSPCKMEYYSFSSGDTSDSDCQPATWAKYHCSVLYNEKMKCIKCKDIFYLSKKTGLLTCLKCKLAVTPLSIQWTCVMCKDEFKSEAKVYNPNEFKTIKLAIKNALLDKSKAAPSVFQCCKEIDVENTTFLHKKECVGELLLGKLHGQQIVVCSKCRTMNLYEKQLWSCPFCYKRQNVNTSSTSDSNKQSGAKHSSDCMNSLAIPMSPKRTPHRYSSNVPSNSAMQNPLLMSPKTKHNGLQIQTGSEDQVAGVSQCLSPKNSPKAKPVRTRQLSFGCGVSLQTPFSIKLEDACGKNNDEDVNNFPSIEEEPEIIKKSLSSKSKMLGPLSQELSRENMNMNMNMKKLNINTNPYEDLPKPLSPMRSPKKASHPVCQIKKMGNELNLSTDEEKEKEKVLDKVKDPPSLSSYEISLNSNETDTSKESFNKMTINKGNVASFNIDDFQILKQIGEGSFGIIYQVESNYYVQQSSSLKNNLVKENFAMKKIIIHSQKDMSEIIREYELINSISSRNKGSIGNLNLNLISIYGLQTKMLDQTTYAMYVLMELAQTDWEKEIIERNTKKSYYSEEELMGIMSGLVYTLAELQRAKIAHRDIKPQNILVFANNEYKIADFGEAKQLLNYKNNQQTIRGTELYMSPILFHTIQGKKSLPHNQIEHNIFKSDVFSLGLCFLFAGTLTINSLYDIREIKDLSQMGLIMNRYLKLRYSGQFIGILQRMLDLNEKSRCDFLELEQIVLNGL